MSMIYDWKGSNDSKKLKKEDKKYLLYTNVGKDNKAIQQNLPEKETIFSVEMRSVFYQPLGAVTVSK